MAIELMARIIARPKSEVDPAEKLVLIVMADRADDDGFLWYAVDTIAERASFTPRAVQRIMDRLIMKGLVKKQHRRDRSNYYVIQVDRFPNVERKRRPKETGPAEYIRAFEDQEPDLFATGDSGSGTGDFRSGTGDSRSGTGDGESPYSLNDSLNDSPIDAHERDGGETLDQSIVRRWNELAAEHDKMPPFNAAMTAVRKAKIEARTKETLPLVPSFASDPAKLWNHVFEIIGRSKLLTGQKLDWAPALDWVLGPKNFGKIMGGNYGHGHDRIGSPSNDPGQRSAVAAGHAAAELVNRARSERRARASGPGGSGGSFAGVGRGR